MNHTVQQTQFKQNQKSELARVAYSNLIPKENLHSPISPIYQNVRQFSERNQVFTEAALRNLIFKADTRKSSIGIIQGNGLIEFGAIVRLGKKVLINEQKFYEWLEAQQSK